MSYQVIETKHRKDGSRLTVIQKYDSFIATISKTKEDLVEIEYYWKYESSSLQSVMAWVNKISKNPIPYKFFESGTWYLPHNNGYGKLDGVRKECFS